MSLDFIHLWYRLAPSVEKPLTAHASAESNILTSSYSPEDEFEMAFIIFKKGFREP